MMGRKIIGFLITALIVVTVYGVYMTIPTIETDEAIIEEVELVRVIDGDTIIVKSEKSDEETIRLLLIDTPETVHPERDEELFGKMAKRYIEQALSDTLYIERGEEELDKFGRTLAYVYAYKPEYDKDLVDESVNAKLVRNGFARVAYIYEPNTKYVPRFRKLEHIAKSEAMNIWSIDGYVTDEGFNMDVVSDELKAEHGLH